MARNGDNKYPGKVPGNKVKAQLTCGEYQKSRLDDLEDAIKQVNKVRGSSGQIMLRNDARTLMEHLEKGEVIFVAQMKVRPARENKPIETVTTIRTFLKGVDILWVVHHVEDAPYDWKATYNSTGAFDKFFIFSGDNVVSFS